MVDARGDLAVTFNGELFNFVELADDLKARGYRFRSSSDTEVLLAAYREYGDDFLLRCNGMWAFVLWDARDGSMFAARDRFGVKPLYFWESADYIVLSSEIIPLAALVRSRVRLNELAVLQFLSLGIADHEPETMLAPVRQLMPGECLRIRRGSMSTRRYYTIAAGHDEIAGTLPASRTAETVRDVLQDAVSLRLRADVPVGAFLSGGLDSSSIVALADRVLATPNRARLTPARLTSFTSYYESSPFDERPRVQAILSRCSKTDARWVRAEKAGTLDDIWDLIRVQELPFHNLSILAARRVLREMAKLGLRVVLDGNGGDELFAGYVRVYGGAAVLDQLLTGRVGRAWGNLLGAGPAAGLAGLGKAVARRIGLPLSVMRHWLPRTAWIRKTVWRQHRDQLNELYRSATGGSLDRRLASDVARFNLPQLLRHLDRNSMAFGIETRLPMLDVRMVELALGWPAQDKVRNGFGKWPLRVAMSSVLPPEVCWHRAKIGFGMEEQLWFRELADVADFDALDEFVEIERVRAAVRNANLLRDQWLWLPVSVGVWLMLYPTWLRDAFAGVRLAAN